MACKYAPRERKKDVVDTPRRRRRAPPVRRDDVARMPRDPPDEVVIACDVDRGRWSVKNHPLSGITWLQWVRVLRAHAIDWRTYAPRIAFLTVMSVFNSIGACVEAVLYGWRVRRVRLREDPVFVVGHPRTGTTHLHNVLARDSERFGVATTFDVGFPSSFLSSRWMAPALGAIMDSTRPMDNMALRYDTPQEDEVAVNQLSSCASPYAPLLFMREEESFRKFYELREDHEEYPIEKKELERWRMAFLRFARKLQYKCGEDKRLLLKSPVHAARLGILREMFPKAQFVFISRHPYDVFKSAVNMADKYYWQCYLQRTTVAQVQEFILKQGEMLHDAYLRDRELLPAKDLYETRFESLDEDLIGTVRALYEHFEWTEFDERVEPALREYSKSLSNFKKNSFSKLSDEAKEVVKRRWRRWFDDLGYDY